MSYNKVVSIYGDRLRRDLERKIGANSFSKVSTVFLGMSSNYILQTCANNKIGAEQLGKLCEFYGLDKDDYILENDTPKETTPQDTTKLLTDIYNVLNKIHAENRDINSRIDRAEKMLQTITSNSTKETEKICAIFTELKYNQK